jgi:hypothetical protein
LVEGGMRRVLGLLACCLALAGCYEAEQEFTGEIEAASLDLTEPVPGGTVYIKCGPIEGVELYPLNLGPSFWFRGGYKISTTNREIERESYLGSGQAFLNFEKSRRLPYTNFFISGLKDGCTAILSAVGVLIRSGGVTIDVSGPVLSDAPRKAPIVPGYEQSLFRFSYSQRIDEEIWRRMHEREGTIQLLMDIINVRRNAIVLSISFIDEGTGRDGYSSAMILDRVAFSDRIVRVKD